MLDGAGEDARIEKSGNADTETVTVVKCDREPLVPVRVTV